MMISVTIPVLRKGKDVLKYSRQREAIKKNLAGRCDHPTAEMVYSDIRRDYPNISLGTVYRNLSLLADLGEIRKISSVNGPDRFDARTAPHCHFRCRKCGCVMDLELDIQEAITQQAAEGFPGIVDDCDIQFLGICPSCMAKP